MKMHEPRRSVYVFGIAGFRGYAAIERLPYLTDNDEVIHRAFPQGPVHFTPRLR
jgi:hypothetical protein